MKGKPNYEDKGSEDERADEDKSLVPPSSEEQEEEGSGMEAVDRFDVDEGNLTVPTSALAVNVWGSPT